MPLTRAVLGAKIISGLKISVIFSLFPPQKEQLKADRLSRTCLRIKNDVVEEQCWQEISLLPGPEGAG